MCPMLGNAVYQGLDFNNQTFQFCEGETDYFVCYPDALKELDLTQRLLVLGLKAVV